MLNPDNRIRRSAETLLSPRELACTGRESREDCIKKDLTLRLKGACEHLSKPDFEVLVSDMTREQLRSENVPGRRIRPN